MAAIIHQQASAAPTAKSAAALLDARGSPLASLALRAHRAAWRQPSAGRAHRRRALIENGNIIRNGWPPASKGALGNERGVWRNTEKPATALKLSIRRAAASRPGIGSRCGRRAARCGRRMRREKALSARCAPGGSDRRRLAATRNASAVLATWPFLLSSH